MRYLGLIICLAACAPKTAILHITYYGEDPVRTEDITPMQVQIDAAAMTAAALVGVAPAYAFDEHTLIVGFHKGPIEYRGDLYAGLSCEGIVRAMFTPKCLFTPDSALLHEMVHQMLGLKHGGDMDPNHTDARWQYVAPIKAALMEHYCPGYVPPFMPEGTDPN